MNSCASRHRSSGFTLVEVLVASFIVAVIGVISYQALDTSIRANEVVQDNLQKMARIDRAWLLIENDLRNVVAHTRRQIYGLGSGSDLPPMVVANSDEEYWLTLLRGGHANPLNFVRSELIRVGYRVQETTLWRDVWYDTASTDTDLARQQKVIEGIERIDVRILSLEAGSFSGGPWLDRWPETEDVSTLPMALEITMALSDELEIKRLYALVKGV